MMPASLRAACAVSGQNPTAWFLLCKLPCVPARSSIRTQKALLNAAHEEFTRFGPAGARVDRIAEAAGCNKQRIYAYFGSKEHLFAEVLNRVHARLAERVPLPVDRAELDEYVGKVFDFHRADSSLLRLLTWEALAYDADAPPWAHERRAFYAQKTADLQRALGLEDPSKVAALLMELIGLACWPFVLPQQRRQMYESHEGATLDSLRDSLCGFARASIAQVTGEAAEERSGARRAA